MTSRLRGQLSTVRKEVKGFEGIGGTLTVGVGAAAGAVIDHVTGHKAVGPVPISVPMGVALTFWGARADSRMMVQAGQGMVAGGTRDLVLDMLEAWGN